MKKLILPLLLLVAFGMLAAVESAPSEVVGYVKYDAYTGYSYVAQPMDVTTTAQAIGIANQAMLSHIYKFNAATQGWESIEYDMDFEEWLGDFNVNPGDVLLFNCTANGPFYSIGDLPNPMAYNIYPGYNYITIPLNRSDLSTAQQLALAMGNLTHVYRFDNVTHGWESIEYDMDFEEWLGNFNISIGDVLLVKSTSTFTWPTRGSMNNNQLRTSNK